MLDEPKFAFDSPSDCYESSKSEAEESNERSAIMLLRQDFRSQRSSANERYQAHENTVAKLRLWTMQLLLIV